MATPLALTPASGAPTPTSANVSGPLASLLASAEKFASPGVSADERYRVVCEIREIASDLAISHEYPNFLSRFVPLFDDFLHKEVPSVSPDCLRLSLIFIPGNSAFLGKRRPENARVHFGHLAQAPANQRELAALCPSILHPNVRP